MFDFVSEVLALHMEKRECEKKGQNEQLIDCKNVQNSVHTLHWLDAYVYAGVVAQTVTASIDYFPTAPATVSAAPVDLMCSASVATSNLLVNLHAATFSAFVPSSTDFVSTVFYMKAGKFASFPPDYYSLLSKE